MFNTLKSTASLYNKKLIKVYLEEGKITALQYSIQQIVSIDDITTTL